MEREGITQRRDQRQTGSERKEGEIDGERGDQREGGEIDQRERESQREGITVRRDQRGGGE